MNPIAEETSDGKRLRNNDLTPCRSVSNSGNPQLPMQTEDDSLTNSRKKDDRKAWLVCIAAFFIQVIIVGNLHVFGIYFISFTNEFQGSKATTGMYD